MKRYVGNAEELWGVHSIVGGPHNALRLPTELDSEEAKHLFAFLFFGLIDDVERGVATRPSYMLATVHSHIRALVCVAAALSLRRTVRDGGGNASEARLV